ncbi:hypothetical protein ACGFIJ_01095 [Microbispora bryophytorum]|uniref:hypothetical protein n=1 Tax=Microbispora bryophytorum TaxID=1460882 RepID=UPI00371EBF65
MLNSNAVEPSSDTMHGAMTGKRRRRKPRTRLLAGLLAMHVLAPSAALANAGPASAAARADCQAEAVFGTISAVAGIIPGIGQIESLFGFLSDIGENWLCGGQNVAQMMMEIAKQQAELVFEENTLDIFGKEVNDQINIMKELKYSSNPTDANLMAQVDDLDDIWDALSTTEQTGSTLSFRALPGMAALASIKLGALTLAYDLETLRVEKWRTLGAARVREAQESLDYLEDLEGQLEQHIQTRFVTRAESLGSTCGTVSCVSKFKIHLVDDVTKKRLWTSGVLTWSGVTPNPVQDQAYKDVLAEAARQALPYQNEIRNIYITDEYRAIKQGLQAQVRLPIPTLFKTRLSPCNDDQYVILRAQAQDDLTVTAIGGSVDGSSLALSGDLNYAQAHDSSLFKPIRFGDAFMYKVRDADLTMHAWGGSLPGKSVKLHGGRDYAEHHPNSLFHTYITAQDELILQASDRDLTVGLSNGQQTQSTLLLGKKLSDAEKDPASRFRFACYPQSARSAPALLWQR